MAKWAIELLSLKIAYRPRSTIKSQAIADFILEWTKAQQIPQSVDLEYWLMYFDGCMTVQALGAGVVVISPCSDRMNYVLQINFRDSNNVAEYEALLHGLCIAASMGIRRIICCEDSDLVIQQVMKTFNAKDPNMAAYCAAVHELEGKFDGIELHHVKRSDNVAADNLARMGAAQEPVPAKTFLEIIHKPSVRLREITEEPPTSGGSESVTAKDEAGQGEPDEESLTVIPAWTQPLLAYLINGDLPEEKNEARRIICRSKVYTVIQGELYKRSVTSIF